MGKNFLIMTQNPEDIYPMFWKWDKFNHIKI